MKDKGGKTSVVFWGGGEGWNASVWTWVGAPAGETKGEEGWMRPESLVTKTWRRRGRMDGFPEGGMRGGPWDDGWDWRGP
jgi:hypothetical protein